MKYSFATLAVLASFATAANAELIIESENNGAGLVVNKLFLNAPGDSTIGGMDLLLELTSGSVSQELVFGNPNDNQPASQAQIDFFPGLLIDTFLASGTEIGGTNPVVTGPSLRVGGPGLAGPTGSNPDIQGSGRLDATFAPTLGQNTSGAQGFFIGQIVLSEDAFGSFEFLVDFTSQAGTSGLRQSIGVTSGVIGIPEPASFALAGLAMVGLAGIRRRK